MFLKIILQKLLRLPFAMPLLVSAVLVLALVGEAAYQSAKSTLTGGIALTDARMDTTKLLQLLTEAESSQRGFFLTNNSAYLNAFHDTEKQIKQNAYFLHRMGALIHDDFNSSDEIRMAVNVKFEEMNRNLELAQNNQLNKAIEIVQSGDGKRQMEALQSMIQAKLNIAEQQQIDARIDIYEALLFNRLAIFVLSCILAIGLYLHTLQSNTLDRERADYQKKLEDEVAEKSRGIKTLAAWLETAREEEKSHLARELHDELGGILTAAKYTLLRIRNKMAHEPQNAELIESLVGHLNQGIALKRRIIEDLRPTTLSILGFHVALENLCSQTQQQLGVTVTANISSIHLKPEMELAMFRVAQEALVNISKYAKATHISVLLEQNAGGTLLRIIDNGIGFDFNQQQSGRHGVAGMQFRMESHGGTLTIFTEPNHGATVEARFPHLIVTPKLAVVA